MRLPILELLPFLVLLNRASSDDCANIHDTAISLESINGKCLAVTKSLLKGSSATACNAIGNGVTYTLISIDNQAENEKIKDGLLMADVKAAYINLWKSNSVWSWANGNPSVYKNPPPTLAPTSATTAVPVRSTLPPDQQRRSTAVVVGVDASLFSTGSLTFAQVDFIRSLAQYISDRGPAEFAFFAYGCTQITPYTSQYPPFVSSLEAAEVMIANLNETIVHDCVRTNPLDFKTMFDEQSIYYNRYSSSIRPFRSSYISMIYFSSSTDSDNINATSGLSPMVQSSVIPINVGSASIDITALSINTGKQGIRVTTPDQIRDLVPQVDAFIFGSTVANPSASLFKKTFSDASIDATVTPDDCAYMNSTDGLWYSDGSCSNERTVLCQYIPPAVPTVNPTLSWSDPCDTETTNFTYFEPLSNAKCYRLSLIRKQFAEAEDVCLSDHPMFQHQPRLTSILSKDEENSIRTLFDEAKDEAMFWFGLKRDPTSSSNWIFVNGDSYNESVHNNWRDGYPRDADGCDCVALVFNDNSWVNTDCNKKLYSICAFRFNSTDKA